MAEALLNDRGEGRFRAFSAGSQPRHEVHTLALKTLSRHGIPTNAPRSKSWDDFARPEAPLFDFVFTVCDRAARETCPIWPGQPMTAHWGIRDPAAVHGSDAEQEGAFDVAFRELDARIRIFTSLPLEALDPVALRQQLDAIGKLSRNAS